MPSGESVKLDKRSGGSNRQRLAKSVAISLLMPITVSCTALTIYFGNASELGIDLPSVLRIVSVLFILVSLVLFAVQLPAIYLWKGKAFPIVNACLLMTGVWLWIEANVFVWDMGTSLFDFTEPFPGFRHVERGTLYIGAILTLIFLRRIYRISLYCSAILIAAQLIGLFPLAWNTVKNTTTIKPNFFASEMTMNRFFDYSKNRDIYVFVLDTLGTTWFEKVRGNIKGHELFKDFTYFPKQIAFAPNATKWAIPKIISGMETKRDAESSQTDESDDELAVFFAEAFSSKTLLDHAVQNGYECSVHSWYPVALYWNPKNISNVRRVENITIGLHNCTTPDSILRMSRLAGLTLFRFVTLSKKRKLYWGGLLTGRLLVNDNFMKRLLGSEYVPIVPGIVDKRFYDKARTVSWNWTPHQKQLKFMHLEGAHAGSVPDDTANLSTEDKSAQSLQDVYMFLDRLKQIENYDSSLIVIMSDHGASDAESNNNDPAAGNKPLLLVKRPGDTHDTMQVNTNPTCVSDTKNAIMTELDWSRSADAFSWFEVPKEIAEKRNVEWTEYLQEKTKLR